MSQRPKVPPLLHAIGGSLGSALALWLLYPLERARIELQQQQRSSFSSTTTDSPPVEEEDTEIFEEAEEESWQDAMTESSEDLLAHKGQHHVTNKYEAGYDDEEPTILSCIRRLYNDKTLYRGASTIVATVGISNFLFFFCNEYFKQQLLAQQKNNNKHLSPAKTLLASCFAGICNVLVTNPLWVANMNLVRDYQQHSDHTLYRELTRIVREKGWRSLWAGTGASIWLVSNPIVQFFVYEQLKQHQHKPNTTVRAFGTGAVAKLVATVLTYPLQVSQTVLRSSDRYQSTTECLIHLYQSNGLFRGMKAKLLQTVLTAALMFLTYEQIVAVLASTLPKKRTSQRSYY